MALASRRPGSQSVELVRAAPGRFAVRGALTFASARRAYEAGVRAFSQESERSLSVDLSAVGEGDSAGLAVLLGWLSWAVRRGVTLQVDHVPESIRALARISEAETLLQAPATSAASDPAAVARPA